MNFILQLNFLLFRPYDSEDVSFLQLQTACET